MKVIETYQVTREMHGRGTFFFTDCGNRMYSTGDEMTYHGKLCPKCLCDGKQVTLYIRGSKEANEYWEQKRDYEIKRAGYEILHFSGTQIYENPMECANDIIDYALGKIGAEQ